MELKFFNFPIRITNLLAFATFFLGLVWFFSGVLFGLDFTDSFYHLNQAIRPEGDIHPYPFLGSSILLKGIVYLVGTEIIYLRLVNSALLLISFLLPFFLIKVRRPLKEIFFTLGIGLFLFAPFNVNILGYDTFSIFFLSLLFSLIFRYFTQPTIGVLILTAILSALAILVRLPNIAVVPIIFILIFAFEKNRKNRTLVLRFPFIYLSITIVSAILGYLIYYGQWNDFIFASADSESYQFIILLSNYLRDGSTVILYCLINLATFFSYLVLCKKFPRIPVIVGLGLFYVMFVTYIVFPSKYAVDYALFIFAFMLTSTGCVLFQSKENSCKQKLMLGGFLLFMLVNPFGSNTGFLKGYSLFVLLPFVFIYSHHTDRFFWRFLALVLVPVSIVIKVFGIYEDKYLLALRETPENELLKVILTSEVRKQYLDNVDEEVVRLRAKGFKIYFYGDKAQIFHYLYPDTEFKKQSFFQPVESLKYFSQIQTELSVNSQQAVFVIKTYPDAGPVEFSEVEEELLKLDFEIVGTNSLRYYRKFGDTK